MRQAFYRSYQLRFKNTARTSRGAMTVKNGYYLFISDGEKTGIGECSFIEGLSIDKLDTYEDALNACCRAIELDDAALLPHFKHYPSLHFGFQMAMLDFNRGGEKIFYPSHFTDGRRTIPINGLVWMGDRDFMLRQIIQKIKDGFTCIKIKVGAIDFDEELSLLEYIRTNYAKEKVELRLDANGAFTQKDVFRKLERLAQYHIHSIEQPIKPGQLSLLRELCAQPAIPIALDEELIGVQHSDKIAEVLETIKPQYIILKPSLLGGFDTCEQWIEIAEKMQIAWWATSALESNIGLNAIAQWVFTKNNPMVQGLGTGSLYTNNVPSPLEIKSGELHYEPTKNWGALLF